MAAEVEGPWGLLKVQTEAHESAWRISEADWQIDQDAGTIVFTTRRGLRVTSPAQIIGTHDSADGTWMWAWANPSISPP